MNIEEDNIKTTVDASNKYIERHMLIASIGIFIYGLLLPQGWETKFGYLAEPIILMRKYTPVIENLAQASTIPELIRGVLGMSFIVSIILGIFMIIYSAPAERIKNAFYQKNWRERIEIFFMGYLAFPFILFMMSWLFYEFSFDLAANYSPYDQICGITERSCNMTKDLLTSRYWLAFYGAILTIGIGFSISALFLFYFGPLILFIKWALKWKR
jgi:hypothetical protein